MRKLCQQIVEAFHLNRRIPTRVPGPIQPERTARFRREMPLHNLRHVRIERGTCLLNLCVQISHKKCYVSVGLGQTLWAAQPLAGKNLSIVSPVGGLVANDTPTSATTDAKQINATGITPAMRYSPCSFTPNHCSPAPRPSAS